MFYDPALFPFARALADNWRAIHAEYVKIRPELVDWFEKDLYDQGWKVFGLFDFPDGQPVKAHIPKCPVTSALVSQHIPRHGAAGFSVLSAGTHITPHQGYQGKFLRCHLGLSIPAGDCGLKVGDEIQRWTPGGVLIFDDRARHQAWNATADERAVLLIDFIPWEA